MTEYIELESLHRFLCANIEGYQELKEEFIEEGRNAIQLEMIIASLQDLLRVTRPPAFGLSTHTEYIVFSDAKELTFLKLDTRQMNINPKSNNRFTDLDTVMEKD